MTITRFRYYLIVVICLIIIIQTVRSFDNLERAGGRLKETREQLAKFKTEQERLAKEKRRVDSPGFVEEEARNKLGMGRAGETTIILPQNLQVEKAGVQAPQEPNWRKWWGVFF